MAYKHKNTATIDYVIFRSDKRLGFTIVELLVVIVVIGILAAIAVVAYNGVQKKAEQAAVLSAVDFYEKTLRMYKAVHGQFPSTPIGTGCLGSGYKATATMGEGVCQVTGAVERKVSPVLDNALAEFSSSRPELSMHEVELSEGGTRMRGLLYTGSGVHPTYGQTAYILYAIDGTNDCGRGDATWISQDGTTKFDICRLYLSKTST